MEVNLHKRVHGERWFGLTTFIGVVNKTFQAILPYLDKEILGKVAIPNQRNKKYCIFALRNLFGHIGSGLYL